MTDFNEFMEAVKKKGIGATQCNMINGETIYLSRGVRELFLENETEEQKIVAIVSRFQNRDYGNAAEHGKESRSGHEYGRYEIAPFESADEDTGVWIHRTENAIKVYFAFER